MYMLSKLFTGGKKKGAVEDAPSTSTSTQSGEIPDIESPDFEKWINGPGNIEKAVEALG